MVRMHIRWMIDNDVENVLAIDEACRWPHQWDRDVLFRNLRKRSSIGMVAEHSGIVQGFVVYDLLPRSVRLTRLGVDPIFRRRGVASQLVCRLMGKLNHARPMIKVSVPERLHDAVLFFKSIGFLATGILPHDDEQDCYAMECRLKAGVPTGKRA